MRADRQNAFFAAAALLVTALTASVLASHLSIAEGKKISNHTKTEAVPGVLNLKDVWIITPSIGRPLPPRSDSPD
jgi:hypothetical protein